MFNEYTAFVQQHGHDQVAAQQLPRLAKWISRQRSQENTLAPERKLALQGVGFRWKADLAKGRQDRWMQQCQALRAFTQQHGHSRLPANQPAWKSLRTWVDRQRRDWEQLAPAQQQALLAAGFQTSTALLTKAEQTWEKRFARLTRFGLLFGHVQVPKGWEVDPDLAAWVGRLRTYAQRLTPVQHQRLTGLGFAWKKDLKQAQRQRWEKRYQELVAFHQVHGHCRVPDKYAENPALGTWVSAQRQRKELLTPAQKQKLAALSFAFTLDMAGERRKQWFRMYGKLSAFHRQHGHARVPENWPEDKTLAIWVGVQRQQRDRLEDWKQRKLLALGFAFSQDLLVQRRDQWEKRWEQLCAFHAQHGHCQVTLTNTPEKALFHWVTKQRQYPQRLTTEQHGRLQQIGFQWPAMTQARQDEKWQARLAELKAFKARLGHCRVPENWPDNPALARWVAFQRRQHAKLKLSPQRTQALIAVDFVFSAVLAPPKTEP
ncbi:MAG: helicase associated domain-containing protein [Bacteroidota bacterium]